MADRIDCSPSVFINSSESEKTRDTYQSALIEFCKSKEGYPKSDAMKYGHIVLVDGDVDALLSRLAEYIREPKRSDVLEELQNPVMRFCWHELYSK